MPRPLLLATALTALVGYEIVEGAVSEKQIVETRRVNFAPSAQHVQLR